MFSHLKKLDVAEATSWIDLPEVSPKARLQLNPATDANPAYYNAMLRRSGKRLRHVAASGGNLSAVEIDQNRAEDRDLFPLYVVANWEGIEDDKGQPVPFNRENVTAFCNALPNWIFDRVRNHASTPERFLNGREPTPESGELAGNSRGASSSS